MIELGLAHAGQVGIICEDLDEHKLMQPVQQYDSPTHNDVNGKVLDPKLVYEARSEEIAGARKHGVWITTPVRECWDATGKGPVGTRWVDINKGDDLHLNYRSRLVGRDFKGRDNRDDLFAATPPIRSCKNINFVGCQPTRSKGGSTQIYVY